MFHIDLDVFRTYYQNLVKCLRMKDPIFLAELSSESLFCYDLKAVVEAQLTSAMGADCFLDYAIIRGLECGVNEPFGRLLLVMERFDDQTLRKMAKNIWKELSDVCSTLIGKNMLLYNNKYISA